MKALTIFCKSIEVGLKTGPDICDITDQINKLTRESNIENGTLCATVIGSTGSLTTIEFEPGVAEDLKKAINRIAPPDLEYEHEKAWHDGNGHSHVQAALLGPSLPCRQERGVSSLGPGNS
ncbi:MAG: YjbQ family protein [Thermodesulfobacteriota bacterium]|nr:YjbQ family protein [Thermodesulfobacteriota bacterium]